MLMPLLTPNDARLGLRMLVTVVAPPSPTSSVLSECNNMLVVCPVEIEIRTATVAQIPGPR